MLSAYLLFSYPTTSTRRRIWRACASWRACRREVRVYAQGDTAGRRYPAIDDLRARLMAEDGVRSDPSTASDSAGSGEMLVLSPRRGETHQEGGC